MPQNVGSPHSVQAVWALLQAATVVIPVEFRWSISTKEADQGEQVLYSLSSSVMALSRCSTADQVLGNEEAVSHAAKQSILIKRLQGFAINAISSLS